MKKITNPTKQQLAQGEFIHVTYFIDEQVFTYRILSIQLDRGRSIVKTAMLGNENVIEYFIVARDGANIRTGTENDGKVTVSKSQGGFIWLELKKPTE